MDANMNKSKEAPNIHIELTTKANNQFNLAKDTLKDKSKLALRISSCSRG